MSNEPIFKSGRPDEGWTKMHNLSDDLVSYEDMISPEFFELEREAIFRPAWHYIGREDRVQKPGMYFTKEIEVLKASILVTRDRRPRPLPGGGLAGAVVPHRKTRRN